MPVVKEEKAPKKDGDKPVISQEVKSYANDPFVLKKAENAKEFLRKHPLPDHLKNR